MADIKDRQSNMAYSSVNAQPAKGGAGGQYTWGSPTDVTDYVAAGIDTSGLGVQTRMVQGGVVVEPAVPYAAQASEFPPIGNPVQAKPVQWGAPATTFVAAPAVMATPFAVMAAPPAVYAAAPATTTTAPVLTVREGVEFDQSHPRHQFAKKPQVTPSGSVIQAIDWSSGGMPTQVQSAIIQAGGGRAHASPVVQLQPAQPVPLTVMRTQVTAAPNYTPTVVKTNAPALKIIQQPRK
jgi:hypothetical protein